MWKDVRRFSAPPSRRFAGQTFLPLVRSTIGQRLKRSSKDGRGGEKKRNKKTEAGPHSSICAYVTFGNCTGGFQDMNESQSIVQQRLLLVIPPSCTNTLVRQVFVMTGWYPCVKKALIERGWTQNHDRDSPFFDLKWTLHSQDIRTTDIEPWQLCNHFFKVTTVFEAHA